MMSLMSRRSFMSTAAAAGGLLPLAGATAAQAKSFARPGLELYTVSAELIKDFDGTLKKVAEIGYREVEFPSFYGRTIEQVRKSLDAAGLNCAASHIAPSALYPNMPSLETDAAAVFGPCRDLGVKYVVCGLPPMPENRKPKLEELKNIGEAMDKFFKSLTLEDWKWISEFMNTMGHRAQEYGLQLTYHNHSAEFRALGDTTAYDELLRLTDPKAVAMEMDCGWVVASGRDPIAYFKDHPGRFPLLHLKDLKAASTNTENHMEPAEIGQGIIDWKKLLTAAQKSGVKYSYVEQEPPYVRPALDSAKASFDYLSNLKL